MSKFSSSTHAGLASRAGTGWRRCRERGTKAMRAAISSTSRSWSKPEPAGSKISTVALCMGVVGDSAARMARSRGRSRSLIRFPFGRPSSRGGPGRAGSPRACPAWDSDRGGVPVRGPGRRATAPEEHPKEISVSGRGLARLAPVVLVLAAGLTACGGESADPPAAGSSSSTDGDSVTVEVTRKDGAFTPNGERVELGVDQTLVLTITSDEAGEFHVHSTPEQEIEYDEGT